MTSSESQVRDFAREFPTPNVQRALALCEAGTLSWDQVYAIFRGSLAHAIFKESLAQGLATVA